MQNDSGSRSRAQKSAPDSFDLPNLVRKQDYTDLRQLSKITPNQTVLEIDDTRLINAKLEYLVPRPRKAQLDPAIIQREGKMGSDTLCRKISAPNWIRIFEDQIFGEDAPTTFESRHLPVTSSQIQCSEPSIPQKHTFSRQFYQSLVHRQKQKQKNIAFSSATSNFKQHELRHNCKQKEKKILKLAAENSLEVISSEEEKSEIDNRRESLCDPHSHSKCSLAQQKAEQKHFKTAKESSGSKNISSPVEYRHSAQSRKTLESVCIVDHKQKPEPVREARISQEQEHGSGGKRPTDQPKLVKKIRKARKTGRSRKVFLFEARTLAQPASSDGPDPDAREVGHYKKNQRITSFFLANHGGSGQTEKKNLKREAKGQSEKSNPGNTTQNKVKSKAQSKPVLSKPQAETNALFQKNKALEVSPEFRKATHCNSPSTSKNLQTYPENRTLGNLLYEQIRNTNTASAKKSRIVRNKNTLHYLTQNNRVNPSNSADSKVEDSSDILDYSLPDLMENIVQIRSQVSLLAIKRQVEVQLKKVTHTSLENRLLSSRSPRKSHSNSTRLVSPLR